jgi:hypothetical protein
MVIMFVVSDKLKLVQLKVEVPGGNTLDLYLGVEAQAPETITMRREYRCSSSEVIMQDPVLFQGRFYERRVLEKQHRQGLVGHEGGVGFMEATQLQEEIQAYVREELEKLKLKDGKLTQDELKAAAEYLAALIEEDSSIKAGFLSSGLASDELDLLLAFIYTHYGLSPQLKGKLKEDCPLAAIRLLRCLLLHEPSEMLTAEFIEYAGQCPPLPELIEVASELILSLSKAQQVQLIEGLESRQDLKIKEKDSLILVRLKASLMHGQRADSGDSDQLRTLRHTIEELKSEVETLKKNSGGIPSTFEASTREMRQTQEALVRDKLNSQGELSEMRGRVAALELKLHSAASPVKEGHQLQALDKIEMREVEERLRRLEVHLRELKGEMQDFKEHFTRTQEAIKTDINTISLANSLPKLPSLEALVQKAIPAEHPLVQVPQLPHYICSYQSSTSNFHWTDMQTGEEKAHTLPNYVFPSYSSVCEGPDNLLFITGGSPAGKEVVSVHMDSLALKNYPPVLTPRIYHGSAYFGGWLYVIGGDGTKLCERYDLQQTWTAIPPLPTSSTRCSNIGVVVSCDKLYCLGG